jgi:hypothetical protein
LAAYATNNMFKNSTWRSSQKRMQFSIYKGAKSFPSK